MPRDSRKSKLPLVLLEDRLPNLTTFRPPLARTKETAGGGIVFDSQPEAEYQESRNKAKSVLQAIKLANTIKGKH